MMMMMMMVIRIKMVIVCSQVDRNNHDGCHNVNLHKYNYMCVMLCSPPVWYPGLYPPSPSVYLILIPPFPDIEKLSEPVKSGVELVTSESCTP